MKGTSGERKGNAKTAPGCIHFFLLSTPYHKYSSTGKHISHVSIPKGQETGHFAQGLMTLHQGIGQTGFLSGAWRSLPSLHDCWQSPVCWCYRTDCGLSLPSSWRLTKVYSHLLSLPLPCQATLSEHGSFKVCRSLSSSPLVLVTQSRLTLRDPMDCSPPGSSVHGIIQTRILEWVAISF